MRTAENGSTKSVVVLIGGGRRHGLTWTASRQLLDRLEAHGDVRGELVFLADYELGLCRGCKVCFASSPLPTTRSRSRPS
jgi:multimeric flavodoxin WrbA